MYMCTDILYNFSTIDDFKDSVAVVASEQRVESGNYDKGYNKKPENRFLKHVSGLAEVFFFFSNSSYCKHHQNSMIQSVRHFETLMTNLCNSHPSCPTCIFWVTEWWTSRQWEDTQQNLHMVRDIQNVTVTPKSVRILGLCFTMNPNPNQTLTKFKLYFTLEIW